MFAKLKESQLFKLLSAVFRRKSKCGAQEVATASPKDASKTENQKGDDKAARPT